MTKKLIIGVSGKKRHGKGSWAQPLVDRGYTELAFADPLRSLVEAQNPKVYAEHDLTHLSEYPDLDQWLADGMYSGPTDLIGELSRLVSATMWWGASNVPELTDEATARRFLAVQNPVIGGWEYIRYNPLVAAVGYTAAKNSAEVRRYLQVTGTEAGRRLIRDSLWVDIAMEKAANVDGHVLLTDCRFPNEAAAVREAGGLLVRVVRPNLAPDGDEHPSETALDDWEDWDHVAVNGGTLAELEADALRFEREFVAER